MPVGEKIYLRILEESDLELTLRWLSTPDIMEALAKTWPVSRASQDKWFQDLVRDKSKIVFAICLKSSDEHIGNVALREIDYINRNAMFSILISDSKYRGQGFGREATFLMLKFAFHSLNLHRVYLKTSTTNETAIQMYKSVGFVQEGHFRQHEYRHGKYIDKLIFSILKDEFDNS